jgi:hypothetical protein
MGLEEGSCRSESSKEESSLLSSVLFSLVERARKRGLSFRFFLLESSFIFPVSGAWRVKGSCCFKEKLDKGFPLADGKG